MRKAVGTAGGATVLVERMAVVVVVSASMFEIDLETAKLTIWSV
jgi:hypothetical protein